MNKQIFFAPGTYQYEKSTLDVADLCKNPIDQFQSWYLDACKNVKSPEAASFATAHLPSGRVSCRFVLVKQVSERGFAVFSNWKTSKKSLDIVSNKKCALTFWWEPLERQVRVEGTAELMSSYESAKYFKTRPFGSKIGAWASPQSQVLSSRKELDEMLNTTLEKFHSVPDIPLPDHWGGMLIVPDEIEFWQGRSNRLHDRFVYKKTNHRGEWVISRLAP